MAEIGEGVGAIWVVFAIEHDYSGPPEFLAAYDGDDADRSASALVAVIKRAGCYRDVMMARVPLWPLIQMPPPNPAELREEAMASLRNNCFLKGAP